VSLEKETVSPCNSSELTTLPSIPFRLDFLGRIAVCDRPSNERRKRSSRPQQASQQGTKRQSILFDEGQGHHSPQRFFCFRLSIRLFPSRCYRQQYRRISGSHSNVIPLESCLAHSFFANRKVLHFQLRDSARDSLRSKHVSRFDDPRSRFSIRRTSNFHVSRYRPTFRPRTSSSTRTSLSHFDSVCSSSRHAPLFATLY